MNLIEKMTGYKATDENMRCKSYQFELGKEYVHDGKLVMCESGFHFCTHPSGVWAYYNEPGTRVFKIEAYDVHPVCLGSGAIVKYVAKRIKFIEEVKIEGEGNTGDYNTGNYNTGDCNTGDGNTGNWNTGNWNTGNWNTGDCNTGHWNTGNRNTGNSNTGNYNTGDFNTGDGNTGNWNTGDGNTGYWNTGNKNIGDRNTGDWNTGDGNTGDGNTGNWNTGIGNATNRSSGFFCDIEHKVLSFNIQTNLTYNAYMRKYPEVINLSKELLKDKPIDFEKYKRLPGITEEKLKALHKKFIDRSTK